MNVIAVKQNLLRRGMNVDLSCPLCGELKKREHMVFGCRWIKPVWFEMLGIERNGTQQTDMTQWMEDRRQEPGSQ